MARGNRAAVLAAAVDATAGEILLHNHPSGSLEPSDADLAVAERVYEAGLGTGIVDNEVRSLYVVVEPPAPARTRRELDPDDVARHLLPGGGLQALYAGYEHRPSQLEMLREVTERYNRGGVALVEAGTGTGKSLAYLLPAVEWALANGERTVVSTNTINLQEQLAAKDLPLVGVILGAGGTDATGEADGAADTKDTAFRWALVKGRRNYVSLRRLLLAGDNAPSLFEGDRSEEIRALVEWGLATTDGSLSDLARRPPDEIWEEVRSDRDVCLGARCPHFGDCFYQKARREANQANVLVVNHALLFSDLSLRRATDNWSQSAVLPPYRRLVLDEAHNVEEAATVHLGVEVTRVGMARVLDRLERHGRRGLLRAVEEALAVAGRGGAGCGHLLGELERRLHPAVAQAKDALRDFFTTIEPSVPSDGELPLRLGRGDPRDPLGDPEVEERLDTLLAAFSRLRAQAEALRGRIEEDPVVSDALEGRVLDLRSIERRLERATRGLGLIFAREKHEKGDEDNDGPKEAEEEWVRWIEGRGPTRGARRSRNVVFAAAPVEPGRALREALFDRVETAIVTSATLATGGGFRFVRDRLGLAAPAPDLDPGAPSPMWMAPLSLSDSEAPLPPLAPDEEALTVTERLLASPFDYRTQVIFCVPTDLPGPGAGADFQEATARVVVDFAALTGGGLFVLFTSHRALQSVARRIRETDPRLGARLLVHGEDSRSRILTRFTDAGDRILLGTASFWEGVDVPGEPLRGLVLQKLPFRVPTEPITQARMEAIEARGSASLRCIPGAPRRPAAEAGIRAAHPLPGGSRGRAPPRLQDRDQALRPGAPGRAAPGAHRPGALGGGAPPPVRLLRAPRE